MTQNATEDSRRVPANTHLPNGSLGTDGPVVRASVGVDGHLRARRKQLEKNGRTILFFSFGAALLLHAALFWANPSGTVDIASVAQPPFYNFAIGEPRDVIVDGVALPGDSKFVAYAVNEEGIRARLAGDEVLREYRVFGEAGVVSVRLAVDAEGHVRTAELIEGTGDDTFDAIFLRLAENLHLAMVPEPAAPFLLTVPISIGRTDRVLR